MARPGKPCDATPDDLPNLGRYLQGVDRGAETPLRVEEAYDLPDEERIAAGLGMDCRHGSSFGRDARDVGDVIRNVVVRKTAEGDATDERLSHELGERGAERVAQRRVDVAVRGNEQQPRPHDFARDEPEEEQRRLVGGMQVVEEHDERALSGDGVEEGNSCIEQADARSYGLRRGGLG